MITNSLLISSCEFFILEGFGENDGSLGLFYANPPRDNSDECIQFAEIENREVEDAALKCARVCSIMALAFGGILLLFGFFKQCLFELPCTQRLMDLSATCVQIVLALVYVIWMSEACDVYYCSYGQGGTYLILTQIFWLAAGIFTRCMRDGRSVRRKNAPPPQEPPTPPPKVEEQEEEVDEEEGDKKKKKKKGSK